MALSLDFSQCLSASDRRSFGFSSRSPFSLISISLSYLHTHLWLSHNTHPLRRLHTRRFDRIIHTQTKIHKRTRTTSRHIHTQDGRLSCTTASHTHVGKWRPADEDARRLRRRERSLSSILVHKSMRDPSHRTPNDQHRMANRLRQEGLIVKWAVFLGLMVLITLYITIGYIHAKKRIRKGLVPLAYHRVRSPIPTPMCPLPTCPHPRPQSSKGNIAY